MLNNLERALINSRIELYRRRAKDHEKKSKETSIPSYITAHVNQARLDNYAADVIGKLLADLETLCDTQP